MGAGFEPNELLRKFYARKGAAWVGRQLGITEGAAHMRAHRLGLTSIRAAGPCVCGDHAFVSLTRGGCAFVDAEDFPLVAGRRWSLNAGGYAESKLDGAWITMHRHVAPSDAPHLDHADHDKTNNRRANLRPCTPADNAANADFPLGVAGYRGVSVTGSGKFAARIKRDGRSYHLGSFDTPELAAAARDEAALRLCGEFATLNNAEVACASR